MMLENYDHARNMTRDVENNNDRVFLCDHRKLVIKLKDRKKSDFIISLSGSDNILHIFRIDECANWTMVLKGVFSFRLINVSVRPETEKKASPKIALSM